MCVIQVLSTGMTDSVSNLVGTGVDGPGPRAWTGSDRSGIRPINGCFNGPYFRGGFTPITHKPGYSKRENLNFDVTLIFGFLYTSFSVPINSVSSSYGPLRFCTSFLPVSPLPCRRPPITVRGTPDVVVLSSSPHPHTPTPIQGSR